MINTLDELFRALGRTRYYLERAYPSTGTVTVNAPDLRIILDDHGELLATVRRLREALEVFVTYDEIDTTDGVAIMLAYDTAITKARAALTGEDTSTERTG
jgi:hypothetical protein